MEAGEALPMMETDVTLFNPNRQEKLILDAKFYREALVSKFGGREKVRRDHLSQILVRTVNLGQPWRKIEERVKEIVKGEGRDEW